MSEGIGTGYVKSYRIDGEITTIELRGILDGNSMFRNVYSDDEVSIYNHNNRGVGVAISLTSNIVSRIVLDGTTLPELEGARLDLKGLIREISTSARLEETK
ncbi:MAG: hypothetical protein AABW51_03065 [Nanoarchaeota archaeon]